METSIKTLSNPIVKDGVQAIVLVKEANNFLDQEYILVQDYNDRGRGDGIKMYGLPGGAIENEEVPEISIFRELFEEIAYDTELNCSFEKFGCYQKLRPNGQTNDNHLFVFRLNYVPDLKTNDYTEVSQVHLLNLRDIIELAVKRQIHEGSIRLIFNFLNGIKSGSLNDLTTLNGYQF